MYASTHADAAQAAAKYGLQQQHTSADPAATNAPSSAVQSAAVDIADAAVHAEVPAGPSVALSNSNTPSADNSAETGATPIASKLTGQCLISMPEALLLPEASLVLHTVYTHVPELASMPYLTAPACKQRSM